MGRGIYPPRGNHIGSDTIVREVDDVDQDTVSDHDAQAGPVDPFPVASQLFMLTYQIINEIIDDRHDQYRTDPEKSEQAINHRFW